MKRTESVILTPAEVATLFRVDPKTVTRWDKAGKLGDTIRTIGGHRRFRRAFIENLLNGEEVKETDVSNE